MAGHIETPRQQIEHLEKLRNLQKIAAANGYPARITEFIILSFVGEQAPKPLRRRVGRDQPVLTDALLLTAVSRLFLGHWIPNHQPSWVKLGLAGATTALGWGCNDIGGTLMEEHITSMAGAQGGTCRTAAELRGRSPPWAVPPPSATRSTADYRSQAHQSRTSRYPSTHALSAKKC